MSQHLDPPQHGTGDDALDDEERIARHLRKRVLEQVSGNVDDRVVRDFPSDRFFAGALAPQSEDQLDDRDDDLQSKMEPSALGANIRIRDRAPGDTLAVDVSGSVWVRVNPTYEEMCERESFVALGDRDDDDEETDELLPVFERLELEVPSIEIPYEAIADRPRTTPDIVAERARNALWSAFEAAREEARTREDLDLYMDTGEGDDEVPANALESEEAFTDYLAERAETGEPALPDWRADLGLEVTPDQERDDGSAIVNLELTNTAQQARDDAIYTVRDPTLFEVRLDLRAEGDLTFVPFTFDPLPEDFRYNRDLWGHGRNCTVVAPDERGATPDGRTPGRRAPQADPSADHLQTRFMPEYRQRVYESADRGVEPKFSDLADLDDGGLDVLDAVATSMQTYLDEAYDAALDNYREREDWNADGDDEDDFQADRDAFARELIRFRRGIRCLRQHPDTVGRAFELMNEAMDRMHEFDSWRLFQLVFIVMELPDIASREHDGWDEVEWRDGDTEDRVERADSAIEVVDVLWFPTGGGKTEAFLGVAVWNMFFDRIRGKDFGVTAWTRFPLRLLSLQQLQRMSETLVYADLVRREQPDIGSHPSRSFSVGYLVGKKNTPNALTGYNNDNFERYQNDEDLREDAKVIPACPACGSDVEMRVTENHRLAHVCTGSPFDCDWQQRETDAGEPYEEDELPVHVVDNELYRYAPTVLAGTIDKITAIGYQRKMAHLITGEMDCECPIHGFASLGECTEKYGCEIDRDDFEDLVRPVEPYDPAPSMMVPDELHLLEESVGSFDGHYETGVSALQDLVGAGQTKVIAPTATITAFEDQVDHLFMRGAERFPAPGPYLRENFYAREYDETQRHYIGLVPHGKTHINAIVDLLYYFHREIQDLLIAAVESPEEVLSGDRLEGTDTTAPLETDSIAEVLEALTRYTTSLTYLLSRKDGDRLDQSIVSQLDTYLRRDDRPEMNSQRMTGGTPFEAVQDLLDRLEDPWEAENHEGVVQRLVQQELFDEDTGEGVLELRDLLDRAIDENDATVDSAQFRAALEDATPDARGGLAWLLTSWLNTITATSMISHGVDIDRFNMMVFFGMPRQTAEYIQSSSRAGRTYPGLVFNVCHPIRERDLSHYHFFEKYHEFLDRLVEPVPVNRWAKNSVRRTHPGLFMGLLLNHYMYRDDVPPLYFGENAEDFVNEIDEDVLTDQIAAMYGGSDDHEEFMREAAELTTRSIEQIRVDDAQWTSERLPTSAMRSLRDVDEQLPIREEWDYRDVFSAFDRRQ